MRATTVFGRTVEHEEEMTAAGDGFCSQPTEQHLGAVGRYIVICPSDDEDAHSCVHAVSEQLADPDRLRLVALEELIATARRLDDRRLADWADRFELRYLPGVRSGT